MSSLSTKGGGEGVELLYVVRSLLKKIKRRVLVGDKVLVGSIDWKDRRGVIENVFERKMEVLDPPVANVNHLLILFSLDQPKLEEFSLTRFLVEAESTRIPVTLALNKAELVNEEVTSVRLPRHVADKRIICGTALVEFSSEEDAMNILTKSLVFKGAELELKPKSVAENGGIDSLLVCIDDTGVQGNIIVAKACCSLLSKLAGSDFNKSTIVERGGLNRLITLSGRLADDPSVIQEVMTIICTLCLRSPGNASLAIEAEAGDLAIQSMQKFPEAYQLQKNSCLMIRNLVARNPENRTLLLGNGIEKIIRKAKENHKSCKDAATAALRDLGLDNYNS